MKLSEFYGEGKQYQECLPQNVDDIVWEAMAGPNEPLEVTAQEMRVIMAYVLGNMNDTEPHAPILINGIQCLFGFKLVIK
mgnify:CR=1 FL=1